ncbi:hypothetical protein BC833DRAFT_656626 [Globomyces pollinis-pini]|nr:hypothetical protein BC833DRAFT_656626 [Globomyces pollinis-pini]
MFLPSILLLLFHFPYQSLADQNTEKLNEAIHLLKLSQSLPEQQDDDILSYLKSHFITPTYVDNQLYLTSYDQAIQKPLDLLHQLADIPFIDAINTLGDLSLFGHYGVYQNATDAAYWYQKSSDLGDPIGHRMLGTLFATGLGVERNYAKALIYMSFAAVEDDPVAHQTLAYWHHAGIGMPKNCERALWHYQRVADLNLQEIKKGPPFGKNQLPITPRLDVQAGGLYGKGASGSGNPNIDSGDRVRQSDLLLLYRLQAEAGDAISQYTLGQFYYKGAANVPADYPKALKYFQSAAKQYPKNLHKLSPEETIEARQVAMAASQSAGYLGRMYWRGEGVDVDVEIARRWFERGVSQDNAMSYYGLALMTLDGIAGIEKDYKTGLHLLNEAAQLGSGEAKVYLAEELLKSQTKDWTKIIPLFESASKKGQVTSYYYLGKYYGYGYPGFKANCKSGLTFMKSFVERTSFHDYTSRNATTAYSYGYFQSALAQFIVAAERGYESGQINAAFLLDHNISPKHPTDLFKISTWNPFDVALPLYIRAANQGHVDARVKVGDIYFYGLLNQTEVEEKEKKDFHVTSLPHLIAQHFHPSIYQLNPDYPAAVAHYSAAAEGEHAHSSIAMFNLGYMYEYGLGVEKDYHLAKRWYDLAMTTNPGSYLPVQIANFILHFKWILKDLYARFNSVEKEEFIEFGIEEEDEEDMYRIQLLGTLLIGIGSLLIYVRHQLNQRLVLLNQRRQVIEGQMHAVNGNPVVETQHPIAETVQPNMETQPPETDTVNSDVAAGTMGDESAVGQDVQTPTTESVQKTPTNVFDVDEPDSLPPRDSNVDDNEQNGEEDNADVVDDDEYNS